MRDRSAHFRTPRAKRLFAALRHSDDPNVSLLHEELDARDKQMRELERIVERQRRELAEKSSEAEALQRVAEATGSAIDLEEMLRVTSSIATHITGTDSCQVYLYDAAHDELVLRAADDTISDLVGRVRLKMGEGITGWVARERKPVMVSKNAMQDHRFKSVPEMREGDFQSMLSVPLVAHGEILGVINVRTRHPREYTRGQVQLLSGIANQVAGAIERSRRYRQLERQAVHLHTLSEVSQAISSNMYLEELLHLFVTMVARTMGYKVCTVMLLDIERQELVIKATQSDNKEYAGKPNLKVGESVAGRVVAEGRIMTLQDVKEAEEYIFPDIAERMGVSSMASVPLLIQGQVIGALNCYTERVHTFTREELAILQALGAQASLAIENSKLMVRSAVIQEMHHRIKNNLQQIVSLVRLEMRFSKYRTVEDALNDTLSRILAISSVHELLSREDLDSVSIKKVAESLLHAARQSVIPSDKTIVVEMAGDDFMMPLHKATSLALVLNELVQNAIEHGFRTLNEGSIAINLEEQEDVYCIRITNDGEALPTNFTYRSTQSLGLSIVETLVRGDLNGTFTIENDSEGHGIAVSVIVPR